MPPLILGILFLECSQLTPAENAAVLEQLQRSVARSVTIACWKDLVASFGEQRDDETIQSRGKSSSHRRAGHVAAAASPGELSGEHQLVPNVFRTRRNTEAYE